MANTSLKFYRGTQPTSPVKGTIWFDETNSIIKVYNGAAWESYDGLANVTYAKDTKVLTVTSKAGASETIDLSDCASAEAVSKALTDLKNGSTSTIKDLDNAIAQVKKDYVAADTTLKSDLEEQIKTAVSSVYKVKGSVADLTALNAVANPEKGDVYNVVAAIDNDHAAGINYVWNGDAWDELGGTIDLTNYVDGVTGGDAVANQFISAVSKSNGTLTFTHRAIAAADVPTLAISKISGLQDALDAKVAKTTTVNGNALSGNITLDGADIVLTGMTAAATYTAPGATDTINSAIAKLTKGVADAKAAAGVTSFGTKTGAITLKAKGNTNGTVNLEMSDNELQASIVGLGSAAFTASTAYDAAGKAQELINALAGSAEGTNNGVKVSVTSSKGQVSGVTVDASGIVGTTSDASTANTVYGAKKYAEEKAAAAVTNIAETSKTSSSNGVEVKVTTKSGSVSGVTVTAPDFADTYDAKGAADDVKTALEGNATTDTKDSATIAGAKKYADSVVASKNVTALGDTYVSATASNNKVTVAATATLTTAVTNANNALQSVSAKGDSYVSASFATKTSNAQALTVSTTTQAIASASSSAKGLAEASDVKNYVDSLTTFNWAAFE